MKFKIFKLSRFLLLLLTIITFSCKKDDQDLTKLVTGAYKGSTICTVDAFSKNDYHVIITKTNSFTNTGIIITTPSGDEYQANMIDEKSFTISGVTVLNYSTNTYRPYSGRGTISSENLLFFTVSDLATCSYTGNKQ